MRAEGYTDVFFEYHLKGALNSAGVVIPVLKEYINPVSVIDVGCGIGAWLSVWKKNGINDVFGVDGSYVDTTKLLVDKSEFLAVDLEKPYTSNKKYDLVTCLEVAEHLPADSAEVLIKSLCMSGDVVLFSAAVPGQGGTLHVNEQYPAYWALIFKRNGFVPVDVIRQRTWNDERIDWYYRQNILLFVKETMLVNYRKLKEAHTGGANNAPTLIRPELLEDKMQRIAYLEKFSASPFRVIKRWVRNLFRTK